MNSRFFKLFALAAALVMSQGSESRGDGAPGYLLNLYHFNIQYVVGHDPSMRRIVEESFEPLVDFYAAHPGWGASFEMQGHMIEYMGERYPAVLSKFRDLVASGQVELVTFHYADQLLLAFPGHDQDWSLRLNEEVLAKYDIKRSGVIFAQEAQFGEGYAVFAKKYGYHTAIITSGHYGWFHDDDRFPFFTVNDMNVLLSREAHDSASDLRVKWMFLGDGELVVTGGISPYFPGLFKKSPLKMKSLEREMQKNIDQGFRPVTVTEYVKALEAAGVSPAPLLPVLDSPWRPGDGSGVFQWMGKYVTPWERDYDMRAENWRLRSMLVEAERAGASGEHLGEAWRHMVQAEVSDPTGWYPLPVEIDWDYEEMEKSKKALIGAGFDPDALYRKAMAGPVCGEKLGYQTGDLVLSGNLAGKTGGVMWQKLEGDLPGFCVTINWAGKGDAGVAFPWDGAVIEYSPAFMEDTIREFDFSSAKKNSIHLALTNGFIGFGDGRHYLVRDNRIGFLPAGLYPEERRVRFEVQSAKEDEYLLRFYLLEGQDPRKVLEFANEVNRVSP